MGEECVRCVVKLALKELQWEDSPGSPLHLAGPPVFLRVCVLGQLQHTPLLRPVFPLHLQDTLTFDRVLTNCTDPSLLKEVITGEHVDIEMIQVAENHEGGKILARYEAPAEIFLFPEPPAKVGQLRTLALSKSRNYQHCPHLTLTTSTSVTKVTIHTPFNTSSPQPLSLVGGPGEILKPPTKVKPRSPQKVGVTTQDKLHLLLGSYTEPCPQQNPEPEKGEQEKKLRQPHRKTRFKAPIPKFTSTNYTNCGGSKSLTGGQTKNFKPRRSLTSTPTDLYRCCTAFLGPHSWTVCPRRSFRKHTRPSQKSTRSQSAPSLTPGLLFQHHRPGRFTCLGGPSTVELSRGAFKNLHPFVAGRVDPRLLAKRDLCGQSPGRVERHFGDGESGRKGGGGVREGEERGGWPTERVFGGREGKGLAREKDDQRNQTQIGTASLLVEKRVREEAQGSGVGQRHPTLPQLYQRYLGRASAVDATSEVAHTESENETTATSVSGSICGEDSEESSNESLSSGALSGGARLTGDSCPPPPKQNASPPAKSSVHFFSSSPSHPPTLPSSYSHTHHLTQTTRLVRRQRRDLLSKYLQYEYGNRRMGTSSPARQIEDKLNLLIKDCCECRHSADSLGRDDLTEDNERLRASLSAERGDQLNKSARLLPQQSVLVGLGGGEGGGGDYWSRRVAEFQGKNHRLVFHETMEKIYRRLYQHATNMK